ncbi:MAG: CopG family transcriptional regulator [Chloroflexota bacterium]
MEKIELTIDENLLKEVDRVIRSLSMTRTTFIRAALELALRSQKTILLERQHSEGYAQHPSKPDEITESFDALILWLFRIKWGGNPFYHRAH